MTANITAGATSHAGDLLTDLKSGYLLGANPRQQFIAHLQQGQTRPAIDWARETLYWHELFPDQP